MNPRNKNLFKTCLVALLISGCGLNIVNPNKTSTSKVTSSSSKIKEDNKDSSTSSKIEVTSSTTTSSSSKENSSSTTSSSSSSSTSSSSSESNSSSNSSSSSSSNSSTSSSSSSDEYVASVSVLNKFELEKAWPINKGDRMLELSIGDGNANVAFQNGEIEVKSSNESVIKVYGLYLRPLSQGSATITVKYKGASDTVKVSISASELTAPTFMFDYDGVTMFKTAENRAVKLPEFICYDKNLKDITDKVQVTSDLDSKAVYNRETGEFTSSVLGIHTVTFTAVDDDNPNIKTTKSFTVGVYKQYLKYEGDWKVGNEFEDDNSQYIYTNNTGFSYCGLNYEPSMYYYIESEVEMPSGHHGGHQIGIAHFDPTTTAKMYIGNIDLGDYNWKLKNFKTTGDGAWDATGEIDNWRIGEYFEKQVPNDNTIKIGMARYGDFFYLFADDQYIGMSTDSEYSKIATYPGLFAHAGGAGSKFTNIQYISGADETMNKINALTHNGKDYFTGYVARGYEWAFDSKNTNNRNFTANSYSEERGLNFDFTNETTHHNGGMVSLYQYFDGDFTFEFEYVPTSQNITASKDQKMWLEARPYNFTDEIFWIGTKFRENDAEQMIKRIKTEETGETWNTSIIKNPKAGAHYKVTRRIDKAAGKCYFDLVITSLADPTQVVEKLNVPYSGSCYDDRLILIWHNTNLKGQYSHIKWSCSAEGGAQ